MNWKNLKEAAFLVIGVMLVLCLYAVNESVDRNGKSADGGRSLVCIQLKAQGQPVEEYEPCMREQVYKLWKDAPIATLKERLCATGAQTEGCEE